MKKRIDQVIVDLGFAPSKTKAQDLIAAGAIEMRTRNGAWQMVKKPGTSVETDLYEFRVNSSDVLKYVSRGGLKLEGVLEDLQLIVDGFTALDVGASTGGFTDCLLQRGAKQVTAVDVSREGELAKKLVDDKRVTFIGGLNARHLRNVPKIKDLFDFTLFDLIVIDVSFISLAVILPEVYDFLRPGGHLLGLIKPQFEVGREHLDKHGIVNDTDTVARAVQHFTALAIENRFLVCDVLKSRVKGKDGNQEYFLYAKKPEGQI